MSVERAADLDLPFLDMGEDWFAAAPYPEFARARAQHPWLARWPIGYVVTDYQAIRDLFNQEAKMAMLYNDIVRLMDAEGTLSVSLPDQDLDGQLTYSFEGKRQ